MGSPYPLFLERKVFDDPEGRTWQGYFWPEGLRFPFRILSATLEDDFIVRRVDVSHQPVYKTRSGSVVTLRKVIGINALEDESQNYLGAICYGLVRVIPKMISSNSFMHLVDFDGERVRMHIYDAMFAVPSASGGRVPVMAPVGSWT